MKIEQTEALQDIMGGKGRVVVDDNKRFQAFLKAFDAQQRDLSTVEGGITVQGGIATLGLLGWVEYETRRKAEEAARAEVMARWGFEGQEDIDALSAREARKFETEVKATTEEKLAQALKDGALEEMEKKASRLYRNTPLPEEDDGNIAF
ncbi:hypothetical protein [Kordiimonas aestuarii]|uniref:hypothetical protein n=1 Tax=Kordiimonas aestuarii TaxID=1005925 RepID=UPI0021D089A8|nr:hypothetical protein [Kordiimonas aestuarii]